MAACAARGLRICPSCAIDNRSCPADHNSAGRHSEAARRRPLLAAFVLQTTLGASSVLARETSRNQEVDAADSPYMQGLLAKSVEKRDERAKAMLKDYMKKNYKDYFQYETGRGVKRGLSEESSKKIQQWLKDNQ